VEGAVIVRQALEATEVTQPGDKRRHATVTSEPQAGRPLLVDMTRQDSAEVEPRTELWVLEPTAAVRSVVMAVVAAADTMEAVGRTAQVPEVVPATPSTVYSPGG
jgi:hypothetical protein